MPGCCSQMAFHLMGSGASIAAARRICCSTAPWMGVSGTYVQARSRPVAGHRRSDARRRNVATSIRQACPGVSGCKSRGTIGFYSTRSEPTTGCNCRQLPRLSTMAIRRACERGAREDHGRAHHSRRQPVSGAGFTREYADARYRAHPQPTGCGDSHGRTFSNRQKRPRPQR